MTTAFYVSPGYVPYFYNTTSYKPIFANLNFIASLDNQLHFTAGVDPVATVNARQDIWQYSADTLTFTYSGDLSGCTLEWILQPNVESASATIKKTTSSGISITSTSTSSSTFVVTLANADLASIAQGTWYQQVTLTDAQGNSNPIATGTLQFLQASNN